MEPLTLGISLVYVIIGFIMLPVAKATFDALTPYDVNDHLVQKDNPALAVSVAGYFLGVIIIYLGSALGEANVTADLKSLGSMVGIDVFYALLGIFLLNVGRVVNDKFVLSQFSTEKEIITDRNVGTGAVEFGSFVATALIVAGSIYGESSGFLNGLLSTLGFFALGQVTLVVLAKFYQFITKYDVHAEIERDNVAAGVAFGAAMIAIGLVVLKSVSMEFTSIGEGMASYGIFTLIAAAILFVSRRLVDLVILTGTTISHEIAKDQNYGAAFIEGTSVIAMASVFFFMV
jgi:uncharacterized membrane protein YjfL (UPF0719 family)